MTHTHANGIDCCDYADNLDTEIARLREQLAEKEARIAPLRRAVWRVLPDDEGEGGETWEMFACDTDMLRIVAEERADAAEARLTEMREALYERNTLSRAALQRWAATILVDDDTPPEIREAMKLTRAALASPGVYPDFDPARHATRNPCTSCGEGTFYNRGDAWVCLACGAPVSAPGAASAPKEVGDE